MINLPEMPDAIARLKRDERQIPVPWFVAWVDGKPEFRVAEGYKLALAVQQKRCWVCGNTIENDKFVFVVGPTTAVTRIHAEPPCHDVCAEFSAKACPFLSMPKAVRREANLPEGTTVPGEHNERNPGVTGLWYCREYDVKIESGGILFRLPEPNAVIWYTEGRLATRLEVMQSLDGGLKRLHQVANKEGKKSKANLVKAIFEARKLIKRTTQEAKS